MLEPTLGPTHHQLLDQFQHKEGECFWDEDNGYYLAANGTRLRINTDGGWIAVPAPTNDKAMMHKLNVRWHQLRINYYIDMREDYKNRLLFNGKEYGIHPSDEERKHMRQLIDKVKSLEDEYYHRFTKPLEDHNALKRKEQAKEQSKRQAATAAVHEITED